MLPAPTTIATSTSRPRIAAICSAIRCTSPASVPYWRSPIKASPESFSRMRLNWGSVAIGVGGIAPRRGEPIGAIWGLRLLADAEVREAGDADVLAGLRGELLAQLLDRLRVVLLGVDVGLVEQGDFLAPLGELALDDLLDHVVGLAFVASLLLEDPLLGLALLRRDLLDRHVLGSRRRDVQGNLVGEGPEVLVAGDEVGLALHFDHRPDLVVGVDVGGDDPLARAAPFALGGRRLPLHPQDLDSTLRVPVGLGKRRLAVHHRGPGPIPQRLHIGSRNAHFPSSAFSVSAGASSCPAFSSAEAVASAAGASAFSSSAGAAASTASDPAASSASPAGGAAGGTAPEEASATAGGGGSPAAAGPAGPTPTVNSVPVIPLIPNPLHAWTNSIDPHTPSWSVSANAGYPSSAAAAANSIGVEAPSRKEKAECACSSIYGGVVAIKPAACTSDRWSREIRPRRGHL